MKYFLDISKDSHGCYYSSDGDRDDYPEITGLVKSFLRDNKIIEILDDKL